MKIAKSSISVIQCLHLHTHSLYDKIIANSKQNVIKPADQYSNSWYWISNMRFIFRCVADVGSFFPAFNSGYYGDLYIAFDNWISCSVDARASAFFIFNFTSIVQERFFCLSILLTLNETSHFLYFYHPLNSIKLWVFRSILIFFVLF